jgi:xanthine dehydrogenase accessory factor
MSLDAATAALRSLEAVERGGSTVSLLVVSGAGAGARFLLEVDADGAERVWGGLDARGGDPRAVVSAAAALDVARAALADPRHRDGLAALPDGCDIYVEVRRPVLDLVIVGAGHIARPMARMGADLGYRVWVLDDRPDFATRERFPEAHAVLRADFADPFRDVPIHGRSHILLVTRGHKYDYDCLVRVLRHDPLPAYIGMIGSRRRVRATFVQLLDDGVEREKLAAIHAPVGLDIGAETPEEIAVAVAAELVKVRRGGSGSSLRDLERVAERFFEKEAEA